MNESNTANVSHTKNMSSVGNRYLSELLRKCANRIDQDEEFDAKLIRETISSLESYYKSHMTRPSPFLHFDPSTGSINNDSSSMNGDMSTTKSGKSHPSTHAGTAHPQNRSEDEDLEKLARDFHHAQVTNDNMKTGTSTVETNTNTNYSESNSHTRHPSRSDSPHPSAPPFVHSSSTLRTTTVAESSSPTNSTTATTTASVSNEKRSFQRPTNPKSTLICNGWVDFLLPRDISRTSSSTAATTSTVTSQVDSKFSTSNDSSYTNNNANSNKNSIYSLPAVPTYHHYSQVLASLVEGRPNTEEETTLWIQRVNTLDPKSSNKLEVIRNLPLRWLLQVRPLMNSEKGVEEYGFVIQVWQPVKSNSNHSKHHHSNHSTPATTTTSPKDNKNSNLQEWLIKVKDEESCSDWMATLLSARDAAKEKLKKQLHASSKTTATATANTTMNSASHSNTPASTTISQNNESSQQSTEDPKESAPNSFKSSSSFDQSQPQDAEDFYQKMSIKELRAIANGAGIDTRGMERADLIYIARLNVPLPSIHQSSAPNTTPSPTNSSTIPPATTVPPVHATTVPSSTFSAGMDANMNGNPHSINSSNNITNEDELRRRQNAELMRKKLEEEEEARRKKRWEEEQKVLADRIAAEAEQRRKQMEEEEQRRREQFSKQKQNQQYDPMGQHYNAFFFPMRAAAAASAANTSATAPSHSTATSNSIPMPTPKTSTPQPHVPSHPKTSNNRPTQNYHPASGSQEKNDGEKGNVNAKYAKAMSDSNAAAAAPSTTESNSSINEEQKWTMIINGLKRQILLNWALVPPNYNMLRSIHELLSTIHTVFPPAFNVQPHAHFAKWTPIMLADLLGTPTSTMGPGGQVVMMSNNRFDEEKIKKAVKKLRFFLHPDRLPRDLTADQSFVCKMLWDITNDSWEEFQKHKDDLDWTK